MMVCSIVVALTGLRYALLITLNFEGWGRGAKVQVVLPLRQPFLEKILEVLGQLG